MSYLNIPLAEDPIADFLALPAEEDPDWGYARNKATALLATSAEWVQSVATCSFELNGRSFFAPNRDYPYQGLQVYQGSENWKLIDCIAVSVRRIDGAPVGISPAPEIGVRANVWRATYSYLVRTASHGKPLEIPLQVSYYLCSENTPDFISGCVELSFPDPEAVAETGLVATIQPFVDIRHMYHQSDPAGVQVQVQDQAQGHRSVHLTRGSRQLTFYLPGEELDLFDTPQVMDWYYKLGSGSRSEIFNERSGRHETRFEGYSHMIASFFNFNAPLSPPLSAATAASVVRLFWSSTLQGDGHAVTLSEVQNCFEVSRRRDEQQYREIQDAFPCHDRALRNAVWARAAGLTRFKSHTHLPASDRYASIPPAGSWWFRTPWFRDVFEGILSSFDTFMALPGESQVIRDSVLLALAGYDRESGRIFNKILEDREAGGTYNSADATLLCFITANRYLRRTRDLGFAREVLPYLENTVVRFSSRAAAEGELIERDGAPRIDRETSLLLAVPTHSWTDTSVQTLDLPGFHAEGLPNRMSHGFLCDLLAHLREKGGLAGILASPNFFLPEINAQWLVLLAGTLQTLELLGLGTEFPGMENLLRRLYREGSRSFREIFWNDAKGYLYNGVYRDLAVRDEVEGECGVTAAALLGRSCFSEAELRRVWECARANLLVRRREALYGTSTLSFGVVTKNEGPGVFYSDGEYHSDVVWPRSTPYLLRLLEQLGEREVIAEILISNLGHQMSEGALFYNHELFSKPGGNNPDPGHERSQNPVPVKNPIQFWSQWCDAYRVHLCKASANGR